MSRLAVGAVVISHGSRGTAFAVTPTWILTCWHCIADPNLTEVIRTSALADLVTQIPSHALPELLAQVHLILSDAYDRGPLWAIMNDRWPELTREQLWEVLDRWTSELPLGGRFGVYADILHYKYAVASSAAHRNVNASWTYSASRWSPTMMADDRGEHSLKIGSAVLRRPGASQLEAAHSGWPRTLTSTFATG